MVFKGFFMGFLWVFYCFMVEFGKKILKDQSKTFKNGSKSLKITQKRYFPMKTPHFPNKNTSKTPIFPSKTPIFPSKTHQKHSFSYEILSKTPKKSYFWQSLRLLKRPRDAIEDKSV
jgi:hypothetical protein